MSTPPAWKVRGRTLALDRPLVMGVVNVTPDSFSDGGRFLSRDAAVRQALALVAEGADVIDIGGESTRPQNAQPVDEDEELRRVMPVLELLLAESPDVVLSVDTVKAGVASRALAAGAHIVNDVSALRLDHRMASVAADLGAGVILMHSRGDVADMGTYAHAGYDGDVLDVVERELGERIAEARAAGIPASHIMIDPGVGFAKRPDDSLRVLAGLSRFTALGYPVAVGASRKRFIGAITGVSEAASRVHGSVGAAVAAYERGATLFRVHDVAETRQALDVAAAIRRAGAPALVHGR